MKKINISFGLLIPACLAVIVSGCSLVGLDFQENYNRTAHPLDTYLHKNVWDYMNTRNYVTVKDSVKDLSGNLLSVDTLVINGVDRLTIRYDSVAKNISRAKGNYVPSNSTVKVTTLKSDTFFTCMLKMIRYSGIDTNLYIQPAPYRTFIVLSNDGVIRFSKTTGKVVKGTKVGTIQYGTESDTLRAYNDCLVGVVFLNGKLAGSKKTSTSVSTSVSSGTTNITTITTNDFVPRITDFPQDFIAQYLKYLILDGKYDHYTVLGLEPEQAPTLLDPGYFDGIGASGLTITASTPFPYTGAVKNLLLSSTNLTIPFPYVAGDNPKSIMLVGVNDTGGNNESQFQLNTIVNVRTSSMLATNGTVHVVDKFVTPVLGQ